MNRDIHNIIAREYERRQKLAADKADQQREELFQRFPRLAEIDQQISFLGIRCNKLMLTEGANKAAILSELTTKTQALIAEKELLLKSNNIDSKSLKNEYCCEKCKDTGFITNDFGSERCSCYKQQIIAHLFSQSNISLTGNESFDNFDISLYPDDINCNKYGIPISPRENISNIKNNCYEFIRNFDNEAQKNLFFSGRTGVGKTFLSFCIARELINMGRTVLYLTAPMLFDIITEHKVRAFKEDVYNDDKYLSIFSVELLIIDDLGTEPLSDARYAELLNILNTRHAKNVSSACKTIISTNMGPKKLFDLYTERVASRIVGHFDRLVLAGEDIRSIKG